MGQIEVKRLLKQKGNLTPFERHLLVIADLASKERDGKTLLTDDEKKTFIFAWQPETIEETREYNDYNQAWRLTVIAELEAQMLYFVARTKMQDLLFFMVSVMNKNSIPFNFLGEPYSSIKIDDANAKDKIIEAIKYTGDKLSATYSILLSYQLLFDEISAIYRIDLSYKIRSYIEQTRIIIKTYNAWPFDKYGGAEIINIDNIGASRGVVDLYRQNILRLLEKAK